jgi:hypothetical protein
VLLVGGGGAGGQVAGGGGGGGGVIYATGVNVPSGTYPVIVGAGGSGGTSADTNRDGKFSSVFGAKAYGGGGGIYTISGNSFNGRPGGSGSGAKSANWNATYTNFTGGSVGDNSAELGVILSSGTINNYKGNVGGNAVKQNTTNYRYNSGGGGGAGQAGGIGYTPFQNPVTFDATKGKGGDGVQINITGTSYYWAAGGGAGGHDVPGAAGGRGGGGGSCTSGNNNSSLGANGIDGFTVSTSGVYQTSSGSGAPNTGSGGGGAGESGITAGNGGSGIVIIRYTAPQVASVVPTTEEYQIKRWNDSVPYSSTSGTRFITYTDGNVGVGTTNPLTKLHVGTGTYNSGAQNMRYFNYATAETAGSTILTDTCSVFDSSIWVKSFIGSSSDTRIKKNIEDINDDTALQKILAIEPKKYNYIDPDRGTSNIYGFLAQQIREVIPEAVTIHSDLVPNIFSVAKCNGNIITFDAPDIITSNIEISELTSNLTIVTGYTSNLVVTDSTSNIYVTEDTSNIIIDITTTSNLTIVIGYTSNVSDSDSTSDIYVTEDTSNVMIDIMTTSNLTIVTGYTSNVNITDSTSNIYVTEDTSNIVLGPIITSNLVVTSTKVPPAFFDSLELYNQVDIIDAYGYRDTYLVTGISSDTASLKLNRDIVSDTVFVYGTQVNDFHTLDKSYIFTLNVCATQSLSEKVVSQNNQITQLTSIISDLTSRIQALEQK